jgi:hypothetical protein
MFEEKAEYGHSKIINPSNGRSGGVIFIWRRDVTIEQIISAPKYIDVKVIESPDKVWRFTGFYGNRNGRTNTNLGTN